MYFVLLAAAIAILVGVVMVAMGWGGEITAFRRDLPMVRSLIRGAADVSMLRLPVGLFGYQQQTADDALDAVAGLLAERDAEIARLREEVWRLGGPRTADAVTPYDDAAGQRSDEAVGQRTADAVAQRTADAVGQRTADAAAQRAGEAVAHPEDAAEAEVLSSPAPTGGQSAPQS